MVQQHSTFTYHSLLPQAIAANVAAALAEDVGNGDLTARLIPRESRSRATVVARTSGVVCGTDWFTSSFKAISADVAVDWLFRDGDIVGANSTLCHLLGPSRTLLTGERTALNFLQMLSGVATKTRAYVDLISGTSARIVDTRKTLPGLRLAQKYAVWAGGGENHRLGLHDAILIKENHIVAAGGVARAVHTAKAVALGAAGVCQFVQVEVESIAELAEALDAGAEMILLDNFELSALEQAVRLNDGRSVLEASGGIDQTTVRAVAETGVDRISIGSLTKDIQALDLSMRFSH